MWLVDEILITTTIPGGTDGDEAQGAGNAVQEEINGWNIEEETVTGRTGFKFMAQNTDILVVQYPRGTTALVWFDQATGAIATSHPGLRDILRRGIRGWDGRVVCPCDGRIFLSAVYDHFFLSGYPVHWLNVSAIQDVRTTYRV